MSTPINPDSQIGVDLALRLGLGEYKREGHDLAGACVACKSSDAFRLHQQTDVAHCFSCGAKWSPFQLAEHVLGDREQAKTTKIAIGAFEPSPKGSSHGSQSDGPDPIGQIAREKSIRRESLVAHSKRRQKDVMPLRRDFADRVQSWMGGKPNLKTSNVLFPIRNVRTSEMLKKDLANARAKWIADAKTDNERWQREDSDFLAYEDQQGLVVDFHSLRKTFITNLTKSGVAPKTAQLLARHSDINLTMNTYTTLGVLDQAAGVEALPPVPTGDMQQTEAAQELRATGTDVPDRATGGLERCPVSVPSSDENGAARPSSRTLGIASDCTDSEGDERGSRKSQTKDADVKTSTISAQEEESASIYKSVPKVGLEPTRSCDHWILNPARLPIPPLRLSESLSDYFMV